MQLLLKNTATNVVLIRGDENSSGVPSAGGKWATSTFDYADLTRYLLVVVGLATPESPEEVALYDRLAAKARDRQPITIREIQPLCRQESLVALPFDESVGTAMEILGSGVHRVLVTSPLGEVVGLLSQARLVEFFWNEGGAFEGVEPLWPMILRDLDVGSKEIMAVRDDKPLADALTFMARESLTSVAVVDSGNNVVGNISTTDVRLLTSSASLPLLQMSCMHFVSVALSERGVEKGRDPFPVFHVYPTSTLAHTVAKLVATRAHRVWVVENSQNHSPGPSVPGTPKLAPAASPSASSTHLAVSSPTPVASLSAATSHTSLLSTLVNPPTSPPQSPLPPATVALAPPSTASMPVPVRAPSPTPPALSHQTGPQSPGLPSIPSSASAAPSTPPIAPGTSALSTSVLTSDLPGARLSGRLLGVVSLTDALNLFARSAGLRPANPGEMRARRRRSSSMSVRPSLEGLLGGRSERSSFDGSAVPSTQPRR